MSNDEAKNELQQNPQEDNNTQSFEQMLDESLITLHTGDVVKGTVIRIANEEVSVNLGYKSDGVIPRGEISGDPTTGAADIVKVGDEIEVFVIRVNDGEGNVLLSRRKLEAQKGMQKLEQAFNDKEVVTGKVTEVVKGGLIVIVNDIRVFVPSSQASNRYVADLTPFVGTEVNLNIIEFDKQKRRIVGSRKELAARELEEAKERVFSSIEVGGKVTGTVSRLADFGAFVNLGGVDGLIHVSEISWGSVKHPREVLKENQEVTATVLKIVKDSGRISLTLKDKDSDPWNNVEEKYIIGSIIEGKVVRLVPFGTFVELEPGVDGLIHISQISNKHVVKPEDELSVGQIIKIKVLNVDSANKKISLSKREADGVALESEPEPEAEATLDQVPETDQAAEVDQVTETNQESETDQTTEA